MNYDKDSREYKDDICAAYALLEGIDARDEKGVPYQAYMQPGSPQEKAARLAIARLLVSDKPLDDLLRRLLAGLFDPNFRFQTRPNPDRIKLLADRIITFTRQSRRNVEHNRRLFLGFEFWKAMGSPKPGQKPPRGAMAKAKAELHSRYAVDERTLRNSYEYARKARWVD